LSGLKFDIDRVKKRIGDYLETPSEENVHDIRTALRRLEARSKVLPKKFKRKNLGAYLELSAKLFKMNSKIRDLDIIRSIITKEKYHDTNLLDRISASRLKLLPEALKTARKLQKLNVRFDPGDLDQKKLLKRLNKRMEDLDAKMKNLLPIVLLGPEHETEIHSLRKTCKRMRYTLECVEETYPILKMLEHWQNYLGGIHDYDVAIAYLNDSKQITRSKEIIHVLKKKRLVQYEEFVKEAKSRKEKMESTDDHKQLVRP
jgi:CHAD domain-containing protein